jgi:PAS domain S-box-containing protein
MSDDKDSKISSTRREETSTEQPQLEELLKAREYLDLAEVMFVALNSNGIVVFVNRKCRKVLGYDHGEIIGKDWFKIFLPKRFRKESYDVFRKLMKGKGESVEYFENPVLTKDGEELIISWHNTVTKNNKGQIDGILGSGQDITERNSTEKELNKLSLVAEQASDGIAVANLDGVIEYINHAWAEMHGYGDPKELIGKSLSIFHTKEQLEQDVIPFNEKLIEKGAYQGEVGHKRRDGTTFPTFMNNSIMRDKEGKPTALLGMARDITERKKTEQALRESEERIRSILDSVRSGIVIIEVDTQTIVDANPAAIQMMGLTRDELIGTVCHKHLCPAEVGKCPILDLGMTVDNSERILRTVEGVEIPVLKTVSRITLGEREYLLESFVDISERKKAEKALQAVTDSTLDAIIMVDPDEQIVFWNPAAEKLFGYSGQEIMGRFMHEAIAPGEYSEAAAKGFEKFRTTGRGPAIGKVTEMSGRRKDGTKFPIELSLAPIPIGSLWGAVGTIRDITERKQNEEQRRQQHSELEVYASLLRHDLRNDVGVILGNVDLAKMIAGENDSEVLETLSSTEAVCERMMNLLKAVSRPAGSIERNIVVLVRSVSSQAQDAHAKLTVNVTVDDDAEELTIVGSRLLPMVFENLLRNAAAHAGEKPIVDMIVSKEGSNVQILVSDNGPGVPEKVRDQLFHRGVSTSGGGLGLYLSRAIVNAMNGLIELMDTDLGEGAAFRILLPLTI